MKRKREFLTGVAMVLMMCCIGVGSAMAWPVPDTGQTKCYNNIAEIPCPDPGEDFYGQDSNYTINPMSYTKLDAEGDDLPDDAPSWVMVRDNVTGLIWEVKQDMDEVQNYTNPHDADNTYTWYDSNPLTNGGNAGAPGDGITIFDTEQFINALNTAYYGGHSDWRMPNIKELASIVNFSISYPGPTIDTAYFSNTPPSSYWSSTTYPYETDHVWVLYCIDGSNSSEHVHRGDEGDLTYYYVRAVRGGQSGSLNSLVNNGDGTVTDSDTGLMWQQATAPGNYLWQDALAYCESLPLGGYNDWRLPTIRELVSLIDYSHDHPAINTTYFPDTIADVYWSSTTDAHFTYCAWCVDFGYYGFGGWNMTSVKGGAAASTLYVHAVRGGQSMSSGHLIISTPNQGTDWQMGMNMPIIWDSQSISGNVSISISYNGGHADTYNTIEESTPNDGACDWTVTAPGESVNCVLKIVPLDDPEKYTTQGLFSITFIYATGLSNDATPTRSKTWTWDADAPGTFRYAIDQNEFWSPEGEFSDVKTASKTDGDGIWYLHVQAKDIFEHIGDVVTVSAILDTTPPTATLSGAPASFINQSDISITVGGEGVTHYQYQIDNGGYGSQIPVSTLIQHSGLSLGSHTLDVLARDLAGNWQTVPTTHAWTIDKTRPTVTGLTDDATPTKSKTWEWDADEPATFRYAIDQNSSWTHTGSYSDVKTASQTSGDGTWYIHVQAKDTAGNEGNVKTVSAILDTTAPTAVISGSPTGTTTITDLNASISGQDVVAYKYRFDGGSYGSEINQANNIVMTGLADGTHTLDVLGKDIAGNWQTTPTTHTWIIEATPPSVTGLADDPTPKKTKTWTWDANEPATFRYAIDQNSTWTPAGVFSDTKTAGKTTGDGIWYLHVQAKDTVGNESSVVTVSCRLDNTPPTLWASPEKTLYNYAESHPALRVTLLSDEPGITIYYALRADLDPYKDGYQYVDGVNLTAGGTTVIRFMAIDPAGNQSQIYSKNYMLDWINPVAPVIMPEKNVTEANPTFSPNPTFIWEPVADAFWYNFQIANNPDFTPLLEARTKTQTQHTLETPLTGDGRWYWRVQSVDEAGNVSGWTTFSFVYIDITLVNKAILVAGGGPYDGNLLWDATKKNANRAHQALVFQGFHPQNIYYLSDDNQTDSVDARATLNNLQYAILTWAQTADNLLIVLIDHGSDGAFRMKENELLTAVQFDTWLDTIQSIIPGSVTVVYDACQSGSFIPLLMPPAGKERYLVASATADKAALFAANGTISFSWYFWSNFLAGEHFYDAYVNAKNAINLSNPQNPMIDVNGNGIANEKNDTLLAENIRIGDENTSAGSPPSIAGISPDQVLQPLETHAMIYAQGVTSESPITRVWAVITPPDLSGSPDDPILDLPTLELLFNPAASRYEGTYSSFTQPGRYSVIVFAENAISDRSLPYETSVSVLYPNPKGDIDGNDVVNLTDLIIALQVLSGIDTAGRVDPNYSVSAADVNGDGKVGIEEIIYIFQCVGGLRP